MIHNYNLRLQSQLEEDTQDFNNCSSDFDVIKFIGFLFVLVTDCAFSCNTQGDYSNPSRLTSELIEL